MEKDVRSIIWAQVHIRFLTSPLNRETAVQRLSIWELRRLTCSMRGKSIVSRKDNTAWAGRPFELNYQSDSCAQYARVVDERAPFFVSHFYRTGLCT